MSLTSLVMNSTSKGSTDWMFVIAGLLVATLVVAVVSPQAEGESTANRQAAESIAAE